VGDAAGLAAAALVLLRDNQRREALGRAAQAWARAHDADWTAAQFEAIYRRL
jgi:glycosyltransferase involved in cell wall biosynthesis